MKAFLIAVALFLPAYLFGEDFVTAISQYDSNQKRITSFVGTGTMDVSAYSTATNSLLQTMSSSLTVYMKSPDKVRFSISGQGGNFDMVQIGDLITQRVPGTNTLVTSKATNSTDLFKKYFNVGISDSAKSVQILSSGQISNQGQVLQKFAVKNAVASTAPTPYLGSAIAPDETDYYFDSNGMLARLVSLSNGTSLVEVDYTFKKDGNVFVATDVTTTVISKGTKIVTTIHYKGASANTVVADKEFELK